LTAAAAPAHGSGERNGMDSRRIAAVYDAVADRYAEAFWRELERKPFDRRWLERLAERATGLGPICDMGCGPGQIAAFLRGCGAEVIGIDLSAAMLDQARRLNPGLTFEQADMLDLRLPPASFGGVAAFYAIVNFDLDQVATAFGGFHRILVPGGYALVAFHVGDGTRQVDEFLGRSVDARFAFFRPDDIVARLGDAGLAVEEVAIRDPYEGVEYPSRRAYVLARKPEPGAAGTLPERHAGAAYGGSAHGTYRGGRPRAG
jgi:SAM-dependent methyltransferase